MHPLKEYLILDSYPVYEQPYQGPYQSHPNPYQDQLYGYAPDYSYKEPISSQNLHFSGSSIQKATTAQPSFLPTVPSSTER